MKKTASLIIVLIALVSCTNDVKFNTPGFQAYRDGVLFRGLDVRAYKSVSTGLIYLEALAQDEQLNIKVSSSNLGTYYFGSVDSNTKASYSSTFNSVALSYETNVIYGPVAKMSGFMIAGGSGYVSDCTLVSGAYVCPNSHATTNTGTGSGLTLSVIANAAGAVTSVKIASPGNGYKAGDVVTIVGGGNNAKITVLKKS